MNRTFEEWIKDLPEHLKEYQKNDKVSLGIINYIWITNIINNEEKKNPTVDELLEWISTNQIDTKLR